MSVGLDIVKGIAGALKVGMTGRRLEKFKKKLAKEPENLVFQAQVRRLENILKNTN